MKSSSPGVQRFWKILKGAALLLAVSLLLLIAELLAIRAHRLPSQAFAVSLLLLSVVYAVAIMTTLLWPALRHFRQQRQEQLEHTFYQVVSGEFKAAPDEVLLFKYTGWWDKRSRVTVAGKAALQRVLDRQIQPPRPTFPNPNKRRSLADHGDQP